MRKFTKFLLALATAVPPLASCNRIPPGITSCTSNEIRFGNQLIRVESKAFAEATNTNLQSEGFKVAAVIDSDNSIMFNEAVTYTGGAYSVPGKHYYFPVSGTVSFYGVYPASQTVSIDPEGTATLSYIHNTDNDLIAAKSALVSSTSSAVTMVFDHLLSQVCINARGAESTVDYKVFNVRITGADGGTYAFADGTWTQGAATAEYNVYSSADGMAVSTGTSTAMGQAMSFVPGVVKLSVAWKCYNHAAATVLCEKNVTVNVTIPQGKRTTLNLSLPFDSSDLTFDSSVGAWTPDSQDIEMVYRPELVPGVFTVCDSPLKRVKFVKGNLYWDGSGFCCEDNQFDYPSAWDTNHVGHFFWSRDARVAYSENYSAANVGYGIVPTTDDMFFAADGGVFEGCTVLSRLEWAYLINNSLCADICKDVHMYGDDNDGCIFHFAGTYEQAKAAFEADEVALEYYAGRSFDELCSEGTILPYDTMIHNVAGAPCVILKPDGFSGTVKESYSASEWAEAESAYGLVALPYSGCRDGSVIQKLHTYAYYWSSTPNSGTPNAAWLTTFDSDEASVDDDSRDLCHSVRLVSVQ